MLRPHLLISITQLTFRSWQGKRSSQKNFSDSQYLLKPEHSLTTHLKRGFMKATVWLTPSGLPVDSCSGRALGYLTPSWSGFCLCVPVRWRGHSTGTTCSDRCTGRGGELEKAGEMGDDMERKFKVSVKHFFLSFFFSFLSF